MGRNRVLLSRESAAHMAGVQAEIGRRLGEEYDLSQPMPDRLAELVRQLGQKPILSIHRIGIGRPKP